MSITFDFILLVFLVVIPGLLFKRFYFKGEFSKQFSTKDPIYTFLLFSIVPGIIFQVLSYVIYILCRGQLDNYSIVIICKELFGEKERYSAVTIDFLNRGYIYFMIHQVNTMFLAFLTGNLFYFIVRYFKLDLKFKLLRFDNQWYYIFSGQIRSFKKFNAELPSNLSLSGEVSGKVSYPAYVDLMVKGRNGSEIISGFVMDYDLRPEDVTKLDRLYLSHAARYRVAKMQDYAKATNSGNGVKMSIPGSVFIQRAEDIINMNVFYIPFESKKNEDKDKVKHGLIGELVIFGLSLLVFFDSWYFHSVIFEFLMGKLRLDYSDVGFWQSLLISQIVGQVLYVFLPKEGDGINEQSWISRFLSKSTGIKVVILILFVFVYWIAFVR